MITIHKIPLARINGEQRIKYKGLLKIVGIDVDGKDKTPYVCAIVDTAAGIDRTAILYLATDNCDAAYLLKDLRFIGVSRGYYLFSQGIVPRPPIFK